MILGYLSYGISKEARLWIQRLPGASNASSSQISPGNSKLHHAMFSLIWFTCYINVIYLIICVAEEVVIQEESRSDSNVCV